MRQGHLIRTTIAVVLPSVLAALMAFQIFSCKDVYRRRNSYIVENLPASTEKVWDALSGSRHSRNQRGTGFFGVSPKIRHPMSSLNKDLFLSTQEEQQKLEQFRESVLQPDLPSLTVHFLWCVDGYFELNQYITIFSLLDQFRPDKIIIHYREKPRTDPHGYWRWLEDLERDVVMLSLRPLTNSKYCTHDLSAGVTSDHFPDPHGVFILGDIAVTNLSRPNVIDYMTSSFLKEKKDLTASEVETLSNSQVFLVPDNEPFHLSQSPGRVVISCPTESDFNKVEKFSSAHCVTMQSYIDPNDLFHKESRFNNFVRELVYGSPKPIEIAMASYDQIPNIVHIVLADDITDISPLLYLSIKSAYVNGKADRVFIHCRNKPKGYLWEKLVFSDHLEPKFIPTGSLSKPNSKQAMQSYLLYTLLQHGGIATLGDTIFITPISKMPLRANAVTTIQKSQYRLRHRTLNTNILMASPGSDFIHDVLGMIYQSQSQLSDIENSLNDLATHISEIKPESVLVDSHLTSHQNCQGQTCVLAGGHDLPDTTYTTRLLWADHKEPETIKEFLNVEGPSRTQLSSLA